MKQLIIRPYQPGDWQSIAAVHDAARLQELCLSGLEDAFLPLAEAAEREGLFDYTVAVAELDGEAAAFTAYTREELAWLYVHPRFMRRGIGSRLVRYVLDHTARPLQLEVLAGNEPALALYTAMGFRELEIRSGSMPGNEAFQVTVHAMTYGQSG